MLFPSWSFLVKTTNFPTELVKIDPKNTFRLYFLIKIGKICLILSYFLLIGHILTYLVKFCLFQSYFDHIMSYLWYFFSWSISHEINNVGQIVDAPPNRVPQETSLNK